MDKWPRIVQYTSKDDIDAFCVLDPNWQVFRKSLKGVATTEKLEQLMKWGELHNWNRQVQVQVDNYINALKRGGQLNMELEVVR